MARTKKKGAKKQETQPVPKPVEVANSQGVLITPSTAEEVGQPESESVFADLSTLKATDEHLDTLSWIDSPVSAALGLSLKATRWQCEKAKVLNNITLGLFMNPDPEEESFGKVRFRRMDGAVLVMRVDGEALAVKEVEDLLYYLTNLSGEMTEFARAEYEGEAERVEKARELVGRRLTAMAMRESIERREEEAKAVG